jgi:hypothetical protein
LPLFFKSAKEIIVIIGVLEQENYYYRRIGRKGHCCYPEISREVTMEAKKQGIEQLFLEKPLLLKVLLEGRIKQFYNAQTSLVM